MNITLNLSKMVLKFMKTNALSIGYMVNNNIRTVNINDINPFENQKI